MGTKQAFKTYTRGQRIQDTNISFAKGMSFTDAPLVEGFSRLLVNYDIDSDSGTLKPRKGLKTVDNGYYESGLPYVLAGDDGISDNLSVVASNQVTHNGENYYQVIVGRTTGLGGEGYSRANTFIGDAWVLTLKQNHTVFDVVHYVPLNDDSLQQKCIFIKPNKSDASIHGVPLHSSAYIKRHIGAFAFNNAYYYFTTDGRLHYTYFDTSSKYYRAGTVNAYQPLQYETQNSRYNMLLSDVDPYTFKCNQASGVLRLTGFAPHEKESRGGYLVLKPQAGVEYDYRLYYSYPEADAEYCLHIEYSPGDDAWFPVNRDETNKFVTGENPFIIPNILVHEPFVQFRIYAILASEATFTESKQLTLDSLAKSVLLTASFNYYGANLQDSTANLQLTRYDLSHARGIVYWKNRIWLFGAAMFEIDSNGKRVIKQDNTVLFASEPNRPDWFPYTSGADIFDEEIIYLQPMLDELLVFTAHNLYSLTLSDDGLSWTKKHLQANLNLTYWDLNLIQIVKNMVFFKSGNYYFMVVPKLTSASGSGLAIAPISKSISSLLDNFKETVDGIIDDLFNYSCHTRFGNKAKVTYDSKLVHYYNYLDYEDVHNTYVFEVTQKTKVGFDADNGVIENTKVMLLNISLLYNTVTRTWRIYTSESEQPLHPLIKNATGPGLYTSLVVRSNNAVSLQILSYNNENKDCSDKYIKQYSETPSDAAVFKNWQYYDSGNLEQNADMKKRFREYQFKIVNESKKQINFYSGFFLDKLTRTYEMYYEQELLVDEENYENTLVIDGIPMSGLQGDPVKRVGVTSENMEPYMYTVLGSWKLGTSKFPNVNTWKIRIPTSGKGYLPRIILISYNQTSYELLSCATVYRQLYSR